MNIIEARANLTIKRRVCRKLCCLFCKILPDKLYIQMLFYVKTGNKPDLKNPMSFNEKINWLKLYDRNPLYTQLADKLGVRSYVKNVIGEKYLIPLLGIWDKIEDIDFEALPNQFVLKCTHDSGSVIICKNKKNFNKEEAIEKLKLAMKNNYFYYNREWAYKNIIPRIIAEQYMVDESGKELKDYKVFMINGEPEFIEVDFERFSNHKRNLYTLEWKLLDTKIEYPRDLDKNIAKPLNLEEMLECARKLTKNIPSVRVDFYSVGEKIYFGELTFYQDGGFVPFDSEEFEKKLGEKIILPHMRGNNGYY